MRKETLVLLTIVGLLVSTAIVPKVTAANSGREYYAYPLLSYEAYTVNYGLNFSTGKQLNIQYYTKVTAQLYGFSGDKWIPLYEENFTATAMPAYEDQYSYERKWSSTWTFYSNVPQRTWNIVAVFIWMDNMNLTNWAEFPDASVQINTTHWSHAVSWSKTISLPSEHKDPPVTDPGSFIILGIACLAVAVMVAVHIVKKQHKSHYASIRRNRKSFKEETKHG